MKIAIIGAGNVGSAIARAGIRTGHVIVMAAPGKDVQTTADKLGAALAGSNVEAVKDADFVVLAVPHQALATIAKEVANAVAGKVIIDVTNPMKPDGSGLAVTTRSGAEELQDLLPDAFVVKAFNTVFASNQATPIVDGDPLDGFYAGNNEAAKTKVAEFLRAVGYRPIDAGDLTAARALEHMAFLNISLNARNGWSWQSAWKLTGPLG